MFLFSKFNFRTSIVRSFVCFVINILIAFNKVQFMGHLWHIRGQNVNSSIKRGFSFRDAIIHNKHRNEFETFSIR